MQFDGHWDDPFDINKFGYEGWELISVINIAARDGVIWKTRFYFKRPINTKQNNNEHT